MEKLKGNTSHKRLSTTIILLASIMFIFFTPLISGFEFDDKIYYENNDLKVEFKDCSLWLFTCLIDGETFGTAELKSHSSVEEVVRYGYGAEETVMYYDFEGWEFYKDGLGEVIFTDERTGKVIEKDYYFVEWISYQVEITDYDSSCDGLSDWDLIKSCTPKVLGTHMETRWRWERLQTKDITNSRIGIKTFVDKDDYIDAIWTIAGKKIGKHAVWTAGLNVDLNNYYKLDESANPVVDSVGNINATASGTAPTVFGIINGAQVFERVNNDIITADSNLGIIGTASRSISVWVNKSADGTTQRIAGYGGACAEVELFGMFFGAGNLIEVGHYGGEDWATGTTVTADLTWHHIVLTYDGTNDYVFLDGAYIDSKSVTISTTDGAFTIGGLSTCLSGNRMDGSIDELGIWSRNLSGTEVSDLYNGGAAITWTDEFTVAPTVTLNDPPNNTNFTTNEVSINCTASDDINLVNVSGLIDGVVIGTNTPANNTLTNFIDTLSVGVHNWTCRAADNESQVTTADTRFFNVTISVSTELVLPIDTANLTSENVSFIINSTPISQDLVSVNITVWFENGTVAHTNGSDLSGSIEVQTNFTPSLGQAAYIWGAETIGTLTSETSANRTFSIHLTPASITINFPRGNIESFAIGDDLVLNWTISESGQNLSEHVVNCSFTYNGVETFLPNISVCVEINETTFTYVSGVNNLSFKVQDEFMFNTTNTTSWTFSFLETGVDFSSSVLETDNDTFSINVSTDETIVSFSAFLNYNGTTSEATSSCVAGDCQIETTIDIPLLKIGQQSENKTFFWQLSIFNGTGTTQINTSTQIQNVSEINFGDCTASVANESVNFTIFNEADVTPLAADFEGFFEYYLGSGTVKKENNHTEAGETGYQFCIDSDETFIVNSQITISQTGFNTRIHTFLEQLYSSSDLNKTLFLLNSTGASTIIIEVKDQGLIPQENIMVNISRFYPGLGKFLTVEHQLTDEFGQIIASLIENSVKYRLQFSNLDGTIIKTSEDITVACRSLICIIPFVLEDTTDEFERFDNLTEYSHSGILFDNTTNIFTFSWNDQRGESATTRFEVIRYMFNESTIVCNETSTETLSTLTCSVGSVRASYKAQVFRTINGFTKRIAILNIKVGDPSQIYGVEGLLWVFLLLMTCIGIGSFNPTVGISLYGAGFVIMGVLGVIAMPIPVFFANTLLVILFIWGINK